MMINTKVMMIVEIHYGIDAGGDQDEDGDL